MNRIRPDGCLQSSSMSELDSFTKDAGKCILAVDVKKEEEEEIIPISKKRKTTAEQQEHAKALKHKVTKSTQAEEFTTSTVMCKQKYVGHLYKVKFASLVLAVYKLSIHGEATCFVVSNDQLDKEVIVNLPVSRLGESVPAPKSMAKTLNEWQQSASEEMVLNLKELPFPDNFLDNFRREQLAGVIRKQVIVCLKGEPFRRKFRIGPVMPGQEMAYFKLGGVGCVTFGYRKDFKSLSLLDEVLGLRWDIFPNEIGHMFVTRLELSVDSEFYLTGCVYVALCRSKVPSESYRETLYEDILSSVRF